MRQILVRTFLGLAIGALAYGAAWLHAFVNERDELPVLQPPDLLLAVTDDRPVPITVTAPDWTKKQVVVAAYRLRTDRTLWQQMHFGDWDTVPTEIREQALAMMIRAYADVFAGPSVWRRMTVQQWDRVPQPIRAMTFLRMIWYWVRYEQVGVEFGLEPTAVAPTVGAIVMAESWFEHRAVNENAWGNRDLGLAQCSDFCRAGLRSMAADGQIGFVLDDGDYFNPWIGTRVATVWFNRELRLSGGDLDLAIRAYHRGQSGAMDEKGDAYLARAHSVRRRYILNRGRSPTWAFLARHIAPL